MNLLKFGNGLFHVFRPRQLYSRNLLNCAYFATTTTSNNTSDNLEKLSYYELLEVRKDATSREIKANFLKLAKTYHPDVYKGSDINRFKYIKVAYQVLKKPQTRRQYDQEQDEKANNSSNTNKNSEGRQNYDSSDAGESYTMDGKYEQKRGFSFDGMKIDPNIDLNKEYEKFFSKPIERKPEEVVVFQDVVERQMDMEERVRHEYAFIKNNQDEISFRFGHQNTYQNILNDNIDLMNKKAAATDAVVDYVMKKREIKLKKQEKIVLGVLLILAIPFVQHILERRQEIFKRIDKGSQLFLRVQEDQELGEFQDRIHYDYKVAEIDAQGQQLQQTQEIQKVESPVKK